MREYGFANNKTNERTVVYARTIEQARAKSQLDPKEWELDYVDYID